MAIYEPGLALVAALAIASCQTTASATPDDRAPTERFERDMMTRFHMHASFDTVRGIERLLIRGKLDDARYFARLLATEPDVPGLAPWAKEIALVRERAAAVATASGIEEACRREAKLAEACAQCHADAGAQAEFRSPPVIPVDQPSIVARM